MEQATKFRIAATSDSHIGQNLPDGRSRLSLFKETVQAMIEQSPDLIIFGGDATHTGSLSEFRQFVDAVSQAVQADIPVAVVLGNHDHWKSQTSAMRGLLSAAGITLLDGQAVHFSKNGKEIGITGVEGYCEVPETAIEQTRYHDMRARRGSTILHDEVDKLKAGLTGLYGDVNAVALHYPTENTEEELATVVGEPIELQQQHLLGAAELGTAIVTHNRRGQHVVDVVFHGHLDFGSAVGQLEDGTPIHNVSAKARQRRGTQAYEIVDLNLS